MSTKDLGSNITIEESLHPAARTAAAQGTGIDLRGYESCTFLCRFGAVADGYFAFVLQESAAQASGFSTIDAADLIGSPPTAFGGSPEVGANTARKITYQGTKRYVRVTITQGLSPAPATGAICGGDILRGHPHQKPTSAT